MRLKQFLESSVAYTTLPEKRFWINEDLSFDELKKHPGLLKYTGPNTMIIDVSDVERVKKAPGENKWNAMRALYGQDEDEIVCAYTTAAWVCLAIKVQI